MGKRTKTRKISDDIVKYMLLFIASVALYARTLTIWACCDDFGRFFPAMSWNIFGPDPTLTFVFRPVERFINAVDISLLGIDNLFISHLAGLAGFIAAAFCVYALASRLITNTKNGAFFAALWFVVSSSNVMSIVQLDALSQQFATLFSLLALILLLKFWEVDEWKTGTKIGYYLSFLFVTLLTLASKETSVGQISVLPIAAMLINQREVLNVRWRDKREINKLITSYLGITAVSIIYLAIRTANAVTFSQPGTQYKMSLTPGIMIKNLILLQANAFYTGSSLDVFPHPHISRILFSAGLLLGVLLISGFGVYRLLTKEGAQGFKTNPFWRHSIALIILILAGSFPAILIQRVGELYTYAITPFAILLFGMLLEHGVHQLTEQGYHYRKIIIQGFLVILLVWLTFGTWEKTSHVITTYDKSNNFFRQAAAWMEKRQEPIFLCISKTQKKPHQGYSSIIVPDEEIASYTLWFARGLYKERIKLSGVDDSDNCQCFVAVQSDRLIFSCPD